MPSELLAVRGLTTEFVTDAGTVHAVRGVSFSIGKGEIVGLVGESGCGKSVTAYSLLRLIPSPPGRIVSGEIVFNGRDLRQLSDPELRAIRGDRIAMIFQEPMTSLNPVFRVGDQIAEVLQLHQGLARPDAWRAAAGLLAKVGVPDPGARVHDYPHQLSGGLCQRVMIAMALACGPDLLIADEPTTALDVSVQAQILDLLLKLRDETGMAVLLITHDFGVIAETADRVLVMYGGGIVEAAATGELFARPAHPYALGLFRARPATGTRDTHGRVSAAAGTGGSIAAAGGQLYTIPGMVPDLREIPPGCIFAPRCEWKIPRCLAEAPPLFEVGPAHRSACFRASDVYRERPR